MKEFIKDLKIEKFEDSIDLLAALFENETIGIFIYNIEGDLVTCNAKACELHGWKKEEMLNMRPEEFIHPDGFQTFIEYQEELQREGHFWGFSVGRRSDGGKFEVEVTGRLIKIGETEYLFGTIKELPQFKS